MDDIKTKKELAVEFINAIRTMDPQLLNALIVREAGEDLAQFFLSYSANLISKDPSRVLENTSSLMLMGYLIRGRIPAELDNPINRALTGAYRPALDWVMRKPKTTLLLALLVFSTTSWPLSRLGC